MILFVMIQYATMGMGWEASFGFLAMITGPASQLENFNLNGAAMHEMSYAERSGLVHRHYKRYGSLPSYDKHPP